MTEHKTLGQISYEAGQDATIEMLGGILDPIPWEDIGSELQECHEASGRAVREQVIQEAIKAIGLWHVTIDHTDDDKRHWYNEGSRAQIEHSLSALRALLPSKDSQIEEGGE